MFDLPSRIRFEISRDSHGTLSRLATPTDSQLRSRLRHQRGDSATSKQQQKRKETIGADSTEQNSKFPTVVFRWGWSWNESQWRAQQFLVNNNKNNNNNNNINKNKNNNKKVFFTSALYTLMVQTQCKITHKHKMFFGEFRWQ